MHIVTFGGTFELTHTKSGGTRRCHVDQGLDYVISTVQKVTWFPELVPAGKILRDTLLDSRIPPFKVNLLGGKGERVLFYTGAGGYGDQLMAQPAVHMLTKLGYMVDVLVDSGNEPCWEGLSIFRKLVSLPVLLSDLHQYNHLALFEVVTNSDSHPGQLHPTDNILFRLGFDPAAIKPEDKRVAPAFSIEEQLLGAPWADYGIYQLASSSPLRNLPPKQAAALAKQLATETGLPWVTVVDKFLPQPYYDACAELGLKTRFFDDVRELMAATVHAKLVVGPDSFTMHLRGMASKASVAYFGPLDPPMRTRYYPTVHGVWSQKHCVYAPCFAHTPSFPAWCPGAEAKACKVIEVAPPKILEAVKLFLKDSVTAHGVRQKVDGGPEAAAQTAA